MKAGGTTRLVGSVLRQVIAGGMLLSALGVGAVVGASPAAAQTAQPCAAPAAPAPGGLTKNINTTQGCNVSAGAASNPVTGYIAVTMPANVTTTTQHTDRLSDPNSFADFPGTYTMTYSDCVGGTATGGTWTLSNGQYSAKPGNLTANTPGGTMSCAYSLAYSGTPPAGTNVRNILTIQFTTGQNAVAASPSVQRFAAAEIPEAPVAVLLPVVGVLAGGVVLIVRRRRSQPVVAH